MSWNIPIDRLEAAMQRRVQALPKILRPFTAENRSLPRASLITGQRGVGKTTFLLHHAQGREMLYLSADNPLLAKYSLYDTVHNIFMNGFLVPYKPNSVQNGQNCY